VLKSCLGVSRVFSVWVFPDTPKSPDPHPESMKFGQIYFMNFLTLHFDFFYSGQSFFENFGQGRFFYRESVFSFTEFLEVLDQGLILYCSDSDMYLLTAVFCFVTSL
jgi:hypothetical protein